MSRRSFLEIIRRNGNHLLDIINTLRCYMNIASRRPEVYYNGEILPRYDAVIPRIGASVTFARTAKPQGSAGVGAARSASVGAARSAGAGDVRSCGAGAARGVGRARGESGAADGLGRPGGANRSHRSRSRSCGVDSDVR